MTDKIDFLNDIVNTKKREVGIKKQHTGIESLIKAIDSIKHPLSFIETLSANLPPRIIAEIKKKSPSKGVIASGIDVKQVAADFESAGACAISVLTDEEYFEGSISDMIAVKNAVTIPVLRKDFIVDEFQVYESRANGADTILLIVKILDKAVNRYLELSRQLGMEPLVEIHNENELKTAIDAGARIIGINTRNLDTFNVSLDTIASLINYIPDNVFTVAESGITSTDIILEFMKLGIDGFLIGETFMRASSPSKKLKEFIDKFRISSFK